MKYVLDSSVALKWVLPEADSAKAIRLRDEYKNGTHQLLAPDIFTAEIANALASAERQGRIKTGESAVFLHDILRAAPALHPTPPLLLRAMALAIANRRAVYDCLYLALAEAEGCELVTADDQFARGLRASYPSSSRSWRCPDAAGRSHFNSSDSRCPDCVIPLFVGRTTVTTAMG